MSVFSKTPRLCNIRHNKRYKMKVEISDFIKNLKYKKIFGRITTKVTLRIGLLNHLSHHTLTNFKIETGI